MGLTPRELKATLIRRKSQNATELRGKSTIRSNRFQKMQVVYKEIKRDGVNLMRQNGI